MGTEGTSDMALGQDPTELSHWRPLRLLLRKMDDEIARIYVEHGEADIRPRFVMPLIRLDRRGPMTVRQLAELLNVTHSAMSQTVAAMRRAGLVQSKPGNDARTRRIALTKRARDVVPLLEAEWQATEQAVIELDEEVPYALSQVVADLEAALAARSFHDRVASHLRMSEESSR
jgi:DNA-binding MarR family transcriptional regulator